jgi:hypothetical protein
VVGSSEKEFGCEYESLIHQCGTLFGSGLLRSNMDHFLNKVFTYEPKGCIILNKYGYT